MWYHYNSQCALTTSHGVFGSIFSQPLPPTLLPSVGELSPGAQKKQQTIALSTAEAEYVSATHIAKQVLWYHSLFKELSFPIAAISTIFTDNQAAISISHHPEFHARIKHIDINLHFLHNLISQGILDTVYVNTHDNLADLFTKELPWWQYEDLTYHIGQYWGIVWPRGSVGVSMAQHQCAGPCARLAIHQ